MISDSCPSASPTPLNTKELSAYTIPMNAPVFTTPTLDFTRHSTELIQLLDKLYSFRNSRLSNKDSLLYLGTDAEEIVKERESQVRWLRDQTLVRFNQLTTPPLKRKVMKKSALQPPTQDDNALHVSHSPLVPPHAFDPTLSPSQKAMYHYIRGRILDVEESHYCKEAEEDLSKAVKLNPKHDEGWNALGECLWKKGDYTKAIHCFKAALLVKRRKETLLNLAQALRLEACQAMDKESFQTKIEESISLCKESLKANIQDGKSWSGLGNCYITQFFKGSRDPGYLSKALKMFDKAEQNYFCDADMLRNRAVIHHYLEHPWEALQDYMNAAKMDPSFSCIYQDNLKSITGHATAMKEAIEKKMSQAKIKELVVVPPPILSSMSLCGFQGLQSGLNVSKLLKVRMVTELPHYFGRAYIGDDGQGKVGGIVFYNISRDIIRPNDIVLVANPVYQLVQWSHEEMCFEYTLVRVEDPTTILVNGKFLSASQIEMTTMTLSQ